MTRDAILLMVYRRGDQLVVNAGALYDDGFHGLEGLIPAEGGLAGLIRALESGEAQALDVTRLPRAKRPLMRVPFWTAAGCDSWDGFMPGTTAVEIVRDDDLTELEYLVPDAKWGALVGTGDKQSFGPGTSLTDIARAVLAIFGAHAPKG